MNDAVPQFTTTYDLKNIVVVAITTLAGVLLYIYARKGEPRLWRQPLKVAVAIVFWIAIATFLYVLVGESNDPTLRRFLPALQVLRDAPTVVMASYLPRLAADQLLNVQQRRVTALLSTAAPWVCGASGIAAAAIALTADAHVAANLETSISSEAFFYRAFFVTPPVFYFLLCGLCYCESFLNTPRSEPGFRRRRLAFGYGSLALGLAGVAYLAWPCVVAFYGGSPPPAASEAYLVVQAILWINFCLSWLVAVMLPYRRSGTDWSMEMFDVYQDHSDRLSQKLYGFEQGTKMKTPTWWTSTSLIKLTSQLLGEEKVHERDLALAGMTFDIVCMLHNPLKGSRILTPDDLRSLQRTLEAISEAMEDGSVQKRLVADDPLIRAVKAADAITAMRDDQSLLDEVPWVQVAAVAAADAGLLTPAKNHAFLRRRDGCISPEILHEYHNARYIIHNLDDPELVR